jgi:hypothetical protein
MVVSAFSRFETERPTAAFLTIAPFTPVRPACSEARLLRIIASAYAEREIQRCLKVVTRIELFFCDGIDNRIVRAPMHDDHLNDTQSRLQTSLIMVES